MDPDRVGEEVRQHLAEADGIDGDGRPLLELDLDLPVGEQRLELLDRFADKDGQVRQLRVERQACVERPHELAEVERAPLERRSDLERRLAVELVEGAGQRRRKTLNRGDRRLQLVDEDRDELLEAVLFALPAGHAAECYAPVRMRR